MPLGSFCANSGGGGIPPPHVHSCKCNLFFYCIFIISHYLYIAPHDCNKTESIKGGALTIRHKAVSFTFKNNHIPQYH